MLTEGPCNIPWVDEIERADAAVGPWSVHLLEMAPELTDADVAKLQGEDEVLGPVKAMLSQGYSPSLDELRALPLYGRILWSMRPTILLQNQVLVRRDGDAVQLVVPQSLRHQLLTHTHAGPLAAPLGSREMLAQLRRLYYWPGMRRDIDAWFRQCEGCAISTADLMATFARSPPVHQWTWSPSTSCRACLLQPMAISTSLWPLFISPNGSRPYPCATYTSTY